MTPWASLYADHTTARSARDLESGLRQRLVRLADRQVCDPTIRGRFTYQNADRAGLRELLIRPLVYKPGEPLRGLPELEDARLTLLALTSRRDGHVHQFTAMIRGRALDDRPWVAAIHLEDDRIEPDRDRKGAGACSHAALHCHVGPTLDDEPKVRVPLPDVGLVDAFDWLLATVVPGWEPAPWPQVVAELAAKKAAQSPTTPGAQRAT